MISRGKRNREGGFALLLVFAMASIVAISLYVALPRVSFEAQRDKEELLIQRGEQYKRGIQLYVRKFKRYPAKMEDLDNANGIRFLRHHYSDPMTGKEEWRLIHAGPGGVLLDSLIKTDKDKDKKAAAQSSITELLGTGGLPEADATANPALRKRPSDQAGAPGSATASAAPGAPIPPDPPQGALPGTLASVQMPGNPYPPVPGQGPPLAGTTPPGTVNAAGSAVNSQTGGISAGPAMGSVPVTNPFPGAQVPGIVTQQINNPAAQNPATPNAQGATEASKLIGQLLTTPRPGGLAGLQAATGNQTLGGGIAGVASTIKAGAGIKIYNEQQEYKKWEFVYDPTKETQSGSAVPQQGAAPGTPIGTQPSAAPTSGFGAAPTTTTLPK